MFVSYRFKKTASKVEAFNLLVEENNYKEIVKCIKDVNIGDYLDQSQLIELGNCKYDISNINPGVSAFWKNLNIDSVISSHSYNPENFPKEEDKIYYKRIVYRGHQSPKLKNILSKKMVLKLN